MKARYELEAIREDITNHLKAIEMVLRENGISHADFKYDGTFSDLTFWSPYKCGFGEYHFWGEDYHARYTSVDEAV